MKGVKHYSNIMLSKLNFKLPVYCLEKKNPQNHKNSPSHDYQLTSLGNENSRRHCYRLTFLERRISQVLVTDRPFWKGEFTKSLISIDLFGTREFQKSLLLISLFCKEICPVNNDFGNSPFRYIRFIFVCITQTTNNCFRQKSVHLSLHHFLPLIQLLSRQHWPVKTSSGPKDNF